MRLGLAALAGLISLPFYCQAHLHFASIGSWGIPSSSQSSSIKELGASNLSFVVSTGPNFPDGLKNGTDESSWESKFSTVFRGDSLNIPLFSVLGEEDWLRSNWTAFISRSDMAYYDPASRITNVAKWTIPNWWYHYSTHFRDTGADGSVNFVFIDTHILSPDFPHKNITEQHWNDLRSTLASAGKVYDWLIVVGDKPIHNMGRSKNALLRLLTDNKVDAYLSGQEKVLEIQDFKNVRFINCGTFSKADMFNWSNKMPDGTGSLFKSTKNGFCRHTLTVDQLITEVIDSKTGEVLYRGIKERNSRSRTNLFNRFNIYKSLPPVKYIPIPYTQRGGPLAPGDLFVTICGTIGLLTMGYIVFIMLATLGRKASR